jgi:estrogen-related receptor beta like 1
MEEYQKNSDTINALTNELHSVSEDLNRVKEKMDSRGASMTDTSPLVQTKGALSKLRAETKQLEIRIGVLTHTLVAKRVKGAAMAAKGGKGAPLEDDANLDEDDMGLDAL